MGKYVLFSKMATELKPYISGIIVVFIAIAGVWYWQSQTPLLVGGDRDARGCLTGGGYAFDEAVGACTRAFELTPDITRAAKMAVDSVGRGYALTVVSFNSYEEPGAYDITLERGTERTRQTVYIRNWQIDKQAAGSDKGGGIACTMEAKICPDGSAVGRSGPKCEFAECPQGIVYRNAGYGLSVALPASWKGYSVSIDKWTGNASGDQLGDVAVASGPVVSIHNPKWTGVNTYQDIPIMVFTIAEWNNLQADKFYIGAAPINPSELARNSRYVFALPARYNYAYTEGYQEVEQILAGKPVTAFEPDNSSGSGDTIILRTTLGQKVSGLGVTLTPLEVTEDSRCPIGVQCFWAGTVKVKTKTESNLGGSVIIFELGKPTVTGTEEITLREVQPVPKAGVKTNNNDYIFQFEVKKR